MKEGWLKDILSLCNSAGQSVELGPMLDEFYELMGWDGNGIPTDQRLTELGLEDFWAEVG